jgi:membrane peptidoglycan carboxypeptidase
MTLLDVPAPPSPPAAPPRRRRWWIGVLAALLVLAVGGFGLATMFYDDVPAPEPLVLPYASVSVKELPHPVAMAFVAAVDPDFYDNDTSIVPSLITRRYAMIAANDSDGGESSWRVFVMASKLQDEYTHEQILGFYLNCADYGRDAVGLVAAARTYFGKQPAQLTVAEAALLAVQLDPDQPETQAGWAEVLDTMVDNGWLDAAERNRLTFPR